MCWTKRERTIKIYLGRRHQRSVGGRGTHVGHAPVELRGKLLVVVFGRGVVLAGLPDHGGGGGCQHQVHLNLYIKETIF